MFKVGDKVTCIENGYVGQNFISLGKTYLILAIDKEFVRIEANDGHTLWLNKNRFKNCQPLGNCNRFLDSKI